MRTGLFLILIGLIGCAKDAKDREHLTEQEILNQLAPAAEVEALEPTIMARLAAIRDADYSRPVLRGTALPGSAEQDIRSLLGKDSEFADCLASKEGVDAIKHSFEPKDRTHETGPKFEHNQSRRIGLQLIPIDKATEQSEQSAAHQKLCAGVPARVQRAIQHERSDSPYRMGVGRFDDGTRPGLKLLRTATVLTAHARSLFLSGAREAAFNLLLDGYRFNQDAARGGGLIAYMLEHGAGNFYFRAFEDFMNQPEPLGDELLGSLDATLAQLILTQNPSGQSITRDFLFTQIVTGLYNAKGGEWEPPGGSVPEDRVKGSFSEDPIFEGRAVVLVMEMLQNDLRAACDDEGKLPIRCVEALDEVSAKYVKVAQNAPKKIVNAGAVDNLGDLELTQVSQNLRDAIFSVLAAVTPPAFKKYLARNGAQSFYLQSHKLHIAYRRLAEKKGRCPSLAELSGPDFEEHLRSRYSGEKLQVFEPSEGRIEVLPSPALRTILKHEEEEFGVHGAVFLCPFTPKEGAQGTP